MATGETIGWIGGFIGALGGIAGGVIGCYFSIKNTNGPRERQSVIRSVIVTVILVTSFLSVLFLTPTHYRWVVWIPYLIALPFLIRKWNSKQMAIRETEAKTTET